MKLEKLLHKLEEDNSVQDLEKYLAGEKRFDRRTCTPEQKEILLASIPQLITKLRKENEVMAEAWVKSPLLRLAFTRCRQNKVKLYEFKKDDTETVKKYKNTYNFYHTAEAMIEIVNQMNKDTQSEALRKYFKEYSKHVKAGDYETDDI